MAKKKEVKIEEKVEVIVEPKKVKKSNAWLEHVKKYRAEHPDKPYKDCLKDARETYKKGGAIMEKPAEPATTEMTPPDAEPVPVKKMKKVKKVKKVKTME